MSKLPCKGPASDVQSCEPKHSSEDGWDKCISVDDALYSPAII